LLVVAIRAWEFICNTVSDTQGKMGNNPVLIDTATACFQADFDHFRLHLGAVFLT
jgi:hypothetical protein